MERPPPNKVSAPPYILIEYMAEGDALSIQLAKYNLPYKFYINKKTGGISAEEDKVADAIFTLSKLHVGFTEVGCGSIIQCGEMLAKRDLEYLEVRDMAEQLVPYIRKITSIVKLLADYIYEHAPKDIFIDYNFLKPYSRDFF